LGSAVVGGAIKGMYSKLGKSGFSPGEEFIVAVREGQKIGATVILGDRDVDVTLKRLSEALRATDLRSLLNPNNELEQSLQQLMPNDKMPVPDSSDEDFKSGLTAYIEVMKAKENVKLIMGQLQKAAPAIYEALVAERDAYMANGLNALNMFPVIVAVMGIAHVDGVEQYLRREGWTPVKLNCQAAK
jgi:pheromone shutdown protein TraB